MTLHHDGVHSELNVFSVLMPLCADVRVLPRLERTQNVIDDSVLPFDLAVAMRGMWSTMANGRTQ